MEEKIINVELLQDDKNCGLKINDIALEDITEKYEIIKDSNKNLKLILTIPLNNINVKANSHFCILK